MNFASLARASLLGFGIGVANLSPVVWAAPAASPIQISLEHVGTYHSGIFNQSAAEIVAHDPKTQRLFVVSAASGEVDVLDIRDPATPTLLFSIQVPGIANSVDVHNGVVAVAVEAPVRTDNGWAAFFTTDGEPLAQVEVGALPDMLTFTPDGKRVLVANEGEPSDDYSIDPEGTVSIIDLPKDIRKLNQQHVRTADFHKFNDAVLDSSIRIFGPNASVAQDLEPEYITVSKDSRTAWVALQENNAIAVLDITMGEFTALHGLGFKDHLLPGNELDVSDQDGAIRILNWPVYGIYQPDAITNFQYRGRTYIVTANEGDARDYPGYSEESRFRALSGNTPICADSARFSDFYASNPQGVTNLSQLRDNTNMGRLTVTRADGLRADGSCYEAIYAFGARSFSIYNDKLEQIYDSGSDIERIIAAVNPANFNANHTANGAEPRSDNKGPEPEAVAVAQLWGRAYAFVGLERVGGIMLYDITNPYQPQFMQYLNHRNFAAQPGTPEALDLGLEDIVIIPAQDSPIRGVPLLVTANEVSGTTSLFRINRVRTVGR